jgi:predicted dehydrogenase
MDSLEAGAHVIVEKPATSTYEELEQLAKQATERGKALIEDHNYVFNAASREIRRRIETGAFGPVVHVDVLICLDILGPGGFADPNIKHPALSLAGGAIADFLPHLASVAHAFVGPHKDVQVVWRKRKDTVLPYDEFRALVDAERGTASLGFSSSSQPDGFWVRVYGEKMQATTNLFETRLTFDRVRGGPKPLRPLLNGLEEGRAVSRAAVGSLLRKFKIGPGAYDGMWDLVTRAYQALATGSALPVSLPDVLAVNRMVDALKPRSVQA